MTDADRKQWNEQFKTFQQALARSGSHQATIDLFLKLHAMVHAADMSQSSYYSFDDALWQGLNAEDARRIPPKGEHSIVWCMWHTARCEDITMNLLVAGGPQVLNSGNWLDRMCIPTRDTGSAMSVEEITAFSAAVDVQAVRGYRTAVGRRTREIVQQLSPGTLKQKTDPARVQRISEEGAVVKEAQWLIDYWSGRTVAGFLTMPATRHNFVHLNEAIRLKSHSYR